MGRPVDEFSDVKAGKPTAREIGDAIESLRPSSAVDPYFEVTTLLDAEGRVLAQTGHRPPTWTGQALREIAPRTHRLLAIAALALLALLVFVVALTVLSSGPSTPSQQTAGGGAPVGAGAGAAAGARDVGASGPSGPGPRRAPGRSPEPPGRRVPRGPQGSVMPAAPSGPAGIPASCVLTSSEAGLGLGEVVWQQEDDGLYASWDLTATNPSSESFSVFTHKVADANEGTRAIKWRSRTHDWFKATDADGKVFDVNLIMIPAASASQPVSGASARISTSVEPDLPTLCDYAYADRVVAVWDRPGCRDALYHALSAIPDTDAAAQEALMGPWAITAPLPDQFNGWSCPP